MNIQKCDHCGGMVRFEHQPFASALSASLAIGVPERWLKNEAKAGRIPYLVVGKTMRFHLASVEAALIAQMSPIVKKGEK